VQQRRELVRLVAAQTGVGLLMQCHRYQQQQLAVTAAMAVVQEHRLACQQMQVQMLHETPGRRN
jgi:hypothetical protein